MRKTVLSVFFIAAICTSVLAQEKRINLYGAYVFDDEVTSSYDSYNYFNGTVKGGFQGGASIEFLPHSDMGIELLWIGQSTTAPLHYASSSYYGYFQERYGVFDLTMNYAMLGINSYAQKQGSKLEGFGGLMLGALFLNANSPETGGSASSTNFAWGIKAGGNIWASDKVAIKIQAQLLSAVQSVGGSLYFGTGGSGASIDSYSSMLQFGLGGGLSFALGK